MSYPLRKYLSLQANESYYFMSLYFYIAFMGGLRVVEFYTFYMILSVLSKVILFYFIQVHFQ